MEKPLKKGGFLTLCAIFVALGIQTGREIAGSQLGHNSNAGDNVEILQNTTELCCLVGRGLACSKMGMNYRAAAQNVCLLLKRVFL